MIAIYRRIALDGPADPDAEAAWDVEIERRLGSKALPENVDLGVERR